MSRLSASILPCRPASLTPPSSIDARDRVAIGVGRVELLGVLRAAELRRLRLELQRAHLVAQRLQRLLVAEPRLVGAAQVLRQVVVEAALLAEAPLVLEPRRQRALQLGLRRLVGELGVLVGERGVGAEVVLQLLARGLDRALELLATRRQRAQLELRFLRLALEVALRFARGVERGAGGERRLVELGLTLLGDAELDVERVEARLALLASRRQLGELGVERGALAAELLASRLRLLGELGQADELEVLAVRDRLQLRGVALARGEMRRGLGARRFGANQAAARFLADQRLRPRLPVEVLDLLRAREKAGLLGVGRVEADRELADRVPFARHDDFAVGQARARGERCVEVARGVDAFEPVAEQGRQARVAEMEQVGEPRQRLVRVRMRRVRRGEEGEPRRRRVGGEGAHGVEPADLERAEALAQRRLEGRFPARLDANPRPESGERFEAMARQPGLELVLDLHLLLQAPAARPGARSARRGGDLPR